MIKINDEQHFVSNQDAGLRACAITIGAIGMLLPVAGAWGEMLSPCLGPIRTPIPASEHNGVAIKDTMTDQYSDNSIVLCARIRWSQRQAKQLDNYLVPAA